MRIEQASTRRRAEALRLLFGHFPEADRSALVQGLVASSIEDPAQFEGLLIALRDEEIAGVVWCQVQAGATAILWPPALGDGESEETADALLAEATGYLVSQRVRLAQSLLESDVDPQAARLGKAGYRYLAKLIYLVGETQATEIERTDLEFDGYDESAHGRLAEIVERSYLGSLDCPALDGKRPIDEVLAGYRAIGAFHPSRWQIVHRQAEDVGCLLLADHPAAGQFELVYMGVVPEARGQGLGRQIVQRAQQLTHATGRSRLVLAVDANNGPALTMYRQAGFVAWNERTVYVKEFRT